MTERLTLWALGLKDTFEQLRKDEEGQAMVEYALILALVSVVAVVVLASIGTGITSIFTKIAADL